MTLPTQHTTYTKTTQVDVMGGDTKSEPKITEYSPELQATMRGACPDVATFALPAEEALQKLIDESDWLQNRG
jgi:hypothetical protein